MSAKRIPDSIKQYRPGPSTEVKLINGHYYVYMYHSIRLASGHWGKKTGKCIGKIIPEKGFIPNRNFHLYAGEESQDDITVLEYGQYDLIRTVANDVYLALCNCFPADRASQIFSYASILYANGVYILTIQKILGHAQLSTTFMYTHIINDQQNTALAQMGQQIMGDDENDEE